ncbi:unnamed protein product [Rangifer tarandus platyrhynchus]|uniref:Uncharacterized protein n=2 Tax=Rangifer tarandus platyrhynchus TaxID=3082113 RepID=A0ABN9A1N8_RANTA|nr:unnamed protein product [Rangifer tarandus platyrhynchus]CAI9712175.1 unnamed protein product [Rangifer tarandus platyrhynchus]
MSGRSRAAWPPAQGKRRHPGRAASASLPALAARPSGVPGPGRPGPPPSCRFPAPSVEFGKAERVARPPPHLLRTLRGFSSC